MKIIKKANVSSNALEIPSEAAKKLDIKMLMFITKNLNTLKETNKCAIQFKDKKGEVTQSEDIIINGLSLEGFEKYSTKLKVDVPINEEEDTTCIKDLKKFLRNNISMLPVRMYYDKGYGWSKDGATGKVRFDGASIAGMDDTILDDHEHHLQKNGDMKKTIKISNEVMHHSVTTQFLLATSLAAPIFGALTSKSLMLNICGKTSQGKTTIMMLCMSLWSKSDDQNICTSWYNTENAICARLNGLEGVPFLLDDTSQGSTKDFTNVIYNIEDGKSKGRLNKVFKNGDVETWNSCIFSTSEKSMYEKTDKEKEGILRRLVEVNVVQGDLIKDEVEAQKVAETCKENYGCVGMDFVNKLFKNGLTENNFEKLSKCYTAEKTRLQISVGEDGISKGLAEKLAVVLLAAKLGREYIGLDFNINDLTEYVQTLILQAKIKIKEVVVEEKNFESSYKEVCRFAEEKLDDRYKTETAYHIPVDYFNVIENKLGYKSKELRISFMDNAVCTFNTPDGKTGLDNTVKIAPIGGGTKDGKKVITVTKMIYARFE